MPNLEELQALQAQTGLSRLTLEVCVKRGLKTAPQIEAFLSPSLEQLTHPFQVADLEKAAKRLCDVRDLGERVWLFGDYDVDGTTGIALLAWVLRELKFDFVAKQPDRFKDGYGLNVGAVEEAAIAGARVLVTVDCGITSFDALARARELGLEVIVVDHHQIDATRGLPDAFAIVNPQRADCTSGLKQLCGCALAFYLAMGLRAEGRARGWFGPGLSEPNLRQHLDLVVIGTAADLVPLTGDNHVLVRQGLQVLKQSQKPGVRALLEAAGLSLQEVSPSHLGFTIGPRINASGRMGSASLAYELLTTQDSGRAHELAHQLEGINAERARVQNAIWDEVRVEVENGISQGRFEHAVVVGSDRWHEGVVGIVASRVVDAFKRPAVVLAFRDGVGKGSTRSYGGKSVLAGLRACAGLLKGFGGHAHAAGLSLDPALLGEFECAFNDAIGAQVVEASAREEIPVDADCELADLQMKTLLELERLGPFGPGNREPLVRVFARVGSTRVIKERHLRVRLETDGVPGGVEGIWFGAAENPERVETVQAGRAGAGRAGRIDEWRVVPEINRFRGNVTPSLRVKAWSAPHSSSAN